MFQLLLLKKKQFILKLRNQIFAPGEKWRWDGKIEGKQFPEIFYGIGNNTSIDDTSNISWNRYDLDQRLLKKFSDNNFFGGQIKIQKLTNFKYIGGINYNDVLSQTIMGADKITETMSNLEFEICNSKLVLFKTHFWLLLGLGFIFCLKIEFPHEKSFLMNGSNFL